MINIKGKNTLVTGSSGGVGDFDEAVTKRNYQVIVNGITTKIDKVSVNGLELNVEKWNLEESILTINTDKYDSYQKIEIFIE